LSCECPQMQGLGHDPSEAGDIDRLQEVIVGTMLHGGNGSFCRAIGRQEDYRHVPIHGLDTLQLRRPLSSRSC
jgi:hypothetical protein